MCCFDCCEDFCDDIDCPVDTDDLELLMQEANQEYQLMGVTFFSRCAPRCVSERTTKVTMLSILCLELGSFVLMCLALNEIIHRPNFKFHGIDDMHWSYGGNCDYHRSVLKDAYQWSELLLPLHSTLLSIGAFFMCCFCKPWKGPLFGFCIRYPFAITVFIYSWLLASVFMKLSNSDCILKSDPKYDKLTDKFDELADWSRDLSIYFTVILLSMFPFVALVFASLYSCCGLPRHCRRICFNRCLLGRPWLTRACLCCVPFQMRANLPARRRGAGRNQGTSNWSIDERKKLVKTAAGMCPLCLDSDDSKTLVLTRGCDHGCCVECLRGYLQADLKDLSKYPLSCFEHKCGALIAYTAVEYTLDNEQLRAYDQMVAKSTLNSVEQVTCPNCEAVMVKPQLLAGGSPLMTCVNDRCQASLCARCGVRWHSDQTCEEFQKALRSRTDDVDAKFEELVTKENWCKCPSCGLVVERTEGCYHMTHLGCPTADDNRTDFCYFCAEPLMQMEGEGWRFSKRTREKHFADGVYSACIKEAADDSDIDDIF